MNAWIDALYKMAGRKHRFIIGLMSGTSLDGLDIAYCRVTGSGSETKVDLQAFRTVPYEDTDREKIRKVFAQKQVDLAYLTMLNSYMGKLHAKMVNRPFRSQYRAVQGGSDPQPRSDGHACTTWQL